MIPKGCQRLAEVDFPIAEVGRHSARKKKVFGYHPQMLNQWWARRPLAACRAILLALLWPDPCDPLCPQEFKNEARKLLPSVRGKIGHTDEDLRKELLGFIADFSNWDHFNHHQYLEISRKLVKTAYPDEEPLVVDPFAGGGSIPLEALRLGCEIFASDLNPVACLILKAILEDVPSNRGELVEALQHAGKEIKQNVEQGLADLYPRDPNGAIPIAYLWARTVRCEAPNCGAEIPIYRGGWLSKKGSGRQKYFKEDADGACVALLVDGAPKGGPISFRIARGHGSEEAHPGCIRLTGTKAAGNNANVICPCCDSVLSGNKNNPRTSTQLSQQRGGADVIFDGKGQRIGGARLLAVVISKPGYEGKNYRLPSERDYQAIWNAQKRLRNIRDQWEREGKEDLDPVPDEPLPPIGTLGFRVQRYGMLKWGNLYTARQTIVLFSLIEAIKRQPAGIRQFLAFICTRLADKNCSLVSWDCGRQTIGHVFNRQALPIVWDFVESGIPKGADHVLGNSIDILTGVIGNLVNSVPRRGQIGLTDACSSPMPTGSVSVWFTDPPYYDAVPYADLSDFFFVWLKRILQGNPLLKDPYDPSNSLTPKSLEIVQDETKKLNGQPKDEVFFENRMGLVFREGVRILREDGIGSVVFAHKTTEGWEALLTGMIDGGWIIKSSWPIATERPGRLRSLNSAALATSVHLICRQRPVDAPVGDWAEVLRELPKRVRNWMKRLEGEGIRGADLVFACIGPALEVFSRYSKVETAEGAEVKLADYLQKVWEVVGRVALEQVLGGAEAGARNGGGGALEEDARLTALFLWTLQSSRDSGNGKAKPSDEDKEDEEENDEDEDETPVKKGKGFSLIFDVVRRFAQPLGINLDKWAGRIIETEKGVVRLLPVAERARQLFGKDGARAVAEQLEASPPDKLQLRLFPDLENKSIPKSKKPGKKIKIEVSGDGLQADEKATTLDRVHAAMLLQASGQSNALRALLKAEQERGPEFLRLANALSALYPKESEEKRLLDAMLLAVPR